MLKQIILDKWKESYKNRDNIGKSAYESVKAKILVEEKSGKYQLLPLNDDIIVGIIDKEIKELKETQSYYKQESQEYKDIEYKISLLSPYLPKQLTPDEVKEIITRLYNHNNEQNKGKLIGLTIKEIGNKFDKSQVAKLVDEVLSS